MINFIAPPLGVALGAARVLERHRQLRCTGALSVEFIDTDEVYAYTLPGPAGTIAISCGLQRALASASPTPALGIAHHGVAARAATLLYPVEHPDAIAQIQTAMVIGATLALAIYQIHHSVMFATDLLR